MGKTKDFKIDVMHEINMLKQHTTAEEKKLLNSETFNINFFRGCIYGQLTGSSSSLRAKNLMKVCCITVVRIGNGSEQFENISITDKKFKIKGPNKEQAWKNLPDSRHRYLSALEAYLFTKNAKNVEILEYIKGNSDTITL